MVLRLFQTIFVKTIPCHVYSVMSLFLLLVFNWYFHRDSLNVVSWSRQSVQHCPAWWPPPAPPPQPSPQWEGVELPLPVFVDWLCAGTVPHWVAQLPWRLGISLKWKLKVFSGCFWAHILPGCSFLNSPYTWLLLSVLISWSYTPASSRGFRWFLHVSACHLLPWHVWVCSHLIAFMSSAWHFAPAFFFFGCTVQFAGS